MTGYTTTVLTMIAEALSSEDAERQKEGLMMSGVLFEKHRGVKVELVEPFSSVELTDDFIDCLFAIVRSKALDERILPSVLGTALWALGKCHQMRAIAAISAVVREHLPTSDCCLQAVLAMENQLTALNSNPTAVRLFHAALPQLSAYAENQEICGMLNRLQDSYKSPMAGTSNSIANTFSNKER